MLHSPIYTLFEPLPSVRCFLFMLPVATLHSSDTQFSTLTHCSIPDVMKAFDRHLSPHRQADTIFNWSQLSLCQRQLSFGKRKANNPTSFTSVHPPHHPKSVTHIQQGTLNGDHVENTLMVAGSTTDDEMVKKRTPSPGSPHCEGMLCCNGNLPHIITFRKCSRAATAPALTIRQILDVTGRLWLMCSVIDFIEN